MMSGQVGEPGTHRAPAPRVLEVQDEAEHDAGHGDRGAGLRQRGPAHRPRREERQVEHRGRGSPFVADEPDERERGSRRPPRAWSPTSSRARRHWSGRSSRARWPRCSAGHRAGPAGRSVRSSGRSAGTPSRTPTQATRAMGALTSRSHSQPTWARAVPPSSGPRTKPDIPTTIMTVMARIRRAWSSKSRKTSELVIGAIAAAATPRAARSAMSSPVVVTAATARLMIAEAGEPPEEHPAAAEPIGRRAGGEQQSPERQRVGPGDPLESGRAAPEVAADRRQRDRQEGVVDHLDEEGETEREHRASTPRGATA